MMRTAACLPIHCPQCGRIMEMTAEPDADGRKLSFLAPTVELPCGIALTEMVCNDCGHSEGRSLGKPRKYRTEARTAWLRGRIAGLLIDREAIEDGLADALCRALASLKWRHGPAVDGADDYSVPLADRLAEIDPDGRFDPVIDALVRRPR